MPRKGSKPPKQCPLGTEGSSEGWREGRREEKRWQLQQPPSPPAGGGEQFVSQSDNNRCAQSQSGTPWASLVYSAPCLCLSGLSWVYPSPSPLPPFSVSISRALNPTFHQVSLLNSKVPSTDPDLHAPLLAHSTTPLPPHSDSPKAQSRGRGGEGAHLWPVQNAGKPRPHPLHQPSASCSQARAQGMAFPRMHSPPPPPRAGRRHFLYSLFRRRHPRHPHRTVAPGVSLPPHPYRWEILPGADLSAVPLIFLS